MKKKIECLLLALLALCATKVMAQNVGRINGQVLDADKKPVEGAIISLFLQKDSSLMKAIFSEPSGKFELYPLKLENYFLSVSYLGFKDYTSEGISLNDKELSVNFPVIQLQNAEASVLKTVEITAKTPFVQRKIDRTIINPDALIGNAGTNALEVLEKAPGVQVNVEGIISLKGKQGVVVFIDDKPTYLAEADLANYLKSLPASSLATIEIMTNPPAKYDAAGNAGVINIKLKKTQTKGLNGSVSTSYGQGFYPRSNNSLNFNYRINKLNFFSNISYNVNDSYQDLKINRRYYDGNGGLNSAFSQRTFIKREMNSATARLGVDYYMNKKSTLGIVLSGFDNREGHTTDNLAELRNGKEDLEKIVSAVNPSKRKFQNGSINLNYAYNIDTLGKSLTFNADYLLYDSKQYQSLLSNTYLPDHTFVNTTNLVSDLPATIDIKTAKIDYTHPLKKGGRMEAGAKTSFIFTNNNANFFDENNGVLTVNNDFSNNFQYNENINAAYINYSFEKKKFALQAGLRYENTGIKGNQLGNAIRKDSSFTRSYNSFFPTLYLSYKLDTMDNHQFGFSYGRRVDRPDYHDMNPFTYPMDRFTLYAGNPFLQPTFSNNLELSHTYKNLVTTTLSYSNTQNVISETIEQNTNIFYSRPGNIGKQISYGISVDGTIPIKKWWTIQWHTELIYNAFTAILYNQQLNNKGAYWYIGPVNQFQISDTWSAELAGSYQTSIPTAQFVTTPVGGMRAALAKKLWKKKATIKLSLSDMLYTFQPGGDIKSLYNSSANWHSYLDTRVLTFAFSYRFASGQNLAARNVGAADSEKTRVK